MTVLRLLRGPGVAVLGWIFTDINDTYIALAAALVFTLTGIDEPDEFFEALGDSTIWLLLAAFIIAAAVTASGLARRLTLAVAKRARSVSHLFYMLTAVLLLTAFIIPATSGRAALMVPIFAALSAAIGNKRVTRALALLFPTIILLSAVASLIGAGAHLVTVEILQRMGGEQIGFGEWLMLGLPFAIVSCFASTAVILFVFLNRDERRQRLQLTAEQLASNADEAPAINQVALGRKEWTTIAIVVVLVVLWSTEALHGINNTIVAILGALAVTAPGIGIVSFKDGIKSVNWTMLLFMAATLELGEALIESGAAEWLVARLFTVLQGPVATSSLMVISVVTIVSLLSHLLITSRTARSSVLVPLVVLLGVSLGYNPTTLAFLSTAAAGFCLTLPVSAKPLAMFNQLKEPTYEPRDLLRLSGFLMPLHFGLLLAFAFGVWPVLGLTLANEQLERAPQAPVWYQDIGRVPSDAAEETSAPSVTPTAWGIFRSSGERAALPLATGVALPAAPSATPTAISQPAPNVAPVAPTTGDDDDLPSVPDDGDARDDLPSTPDDDVIDEARDDDAINEIPVVPEVDEDGGDTEEAPAAPGVDEAPLSPTPAADDEDVLPPIPEADDELPAATDSEAETDNDSDGVETDDDD